MKHDRALEVWQIDNQKHFFAVFARLLIDLLDFAKREFVEPLDGLRAAVMVIYVCGYREQKQHDVSLMRYEYNENTSLIALNTNTSCEFEETKSNAHQHIPSMKTHSY